MYEFENKVKASTFDTKLKDFKSGDIVKVMYKKSGGYYNILDIKIAEQSEIVTADKIKEIDQKVWIEKDKRIARQNCNERAIETLDLMWKIQPERLKEIIKANEDNLLKILDMLADHWENRVWTGQNQEKIEEIKEEAI